MQVLLPEIRPGAQGVSSCPEYGCGEGQESPELVLDAKQEAENGSKIDNGRSKSCSAVMQSEISAHKLPRLSH